MALTLSALLLAFVLPVQTSLTSGAPASPAAAGAATGGTAGGPSAKKRGHDLADILLSVAGSGRHSGGAPPSPPSNGDVQVSSPDAKLQYDPVIAIDPTDPHHLVAAGTDTRSTPTKAAFYASFDDGQTWSETFLDNAFEPSVAFENDGSLYLAAITITSTYPVWVEDVLFGRSYDGGLTTTDWIQVTSSIAGSIRLPTILVDNTGSYYDGRIYLVYTVVQPYHGDSYTVLAYSEDFGQYWDFDVPSTHYAKPGATAAVDSSGVLHVAFFDVTSGEEGICVVASTDGGLSFEADVRIARAGYYQIPGFPGANFDAVPSLAVDLSGGPYHDALYVTWTRPGSPEPDVVFSSSGDHGATWSTPVFASDVTTNSQYSPCVAVDPLGTVNFSFYDARDDSGNRIVRRYLSRSSDGGATLLPNVGVSTVGFDPSLDDRGYEAALPRSM